MDSRRALPRRVRAHTGTVRVRTTLAAVAVVGVALLVGAAALVVGMREALSAELRNAAELRAQDLATLLTELARPGELTLHDQEDLLVQVLDGQGVVVAASPVLAGYPAVAQLEHGGAAEITVPVEDGDFLAVAAGADTADGPRTVIVARGLEQVDEPVQVVIGLLLVGLPLLLVVVAATTWSVAGRALSPVDSIRAEVDEISAAELHRRVPSPPGNDEIARLAATMNRMLERLEHAQSRQHRFISDASHELRSPVAAIRQHAEVAVAHPEHTTVGQLAETVLAENLRVQHMVEDLLLLARTDEHAMRLHGRQVDMDDLVFDEARRLRGATSLLIGVAAVSAGRVTGDIAALRRVLRNLGDNAARHARTRIEFSLAERDNRVVLGVDDDGSGVAVPDRERVFERFVRLDEARARDAGGAGLGLAIVADVVAAHDGTVTMTISRLGGASVRVTLPAFVG